MVKGHRPNSAPKYSRFVVTRNGHGSCDPTVHIHGHSITGRRAWWLSGPSLSIHCVAASIPTQEKCKKNKHIPSICPPKTGVCYVFFLSCCWWLEIGRHLYRYHVVCKDTVELSHLKASITLGCHGRMTHTRRPAIIVIRLATRAGRDVAVIVVAAIRRS